MLIVLELIDQTAGGRVPVIVKQGAAFHDRDAVPEEFSHLVVFRILPGVCAWQVQVASQA